MAKAKLTIRQKQSRKINRKRGLRKWWQTTSRRCIILSLAIGAISLSTGSWWFWHSGRLEQTLATLSGRFWNETSVWGFKVDRNKVLLEGRGFTPLGDIAKAIDIKGGEPILALSLTDMRNRLQAIPRVRYAEVARVLPDQLHIKIVEREPVALWQNAGKLQLVDDEGVVMEYADISQYKNLMLVVGEDAPMHAHEIIGILAQEPALYKNVVAAVRVGERRWNIRFKNGIELKLPEDKTLAAWQNFARMDAEHHMLDRAITSVDMRLSDRVFIKAAPAEAKPAKVPGSET